MVKINILIVDDNPDKLLTYEVILDQLGENLIKANSGSEALEHLLKSDIALILCDVKMPDLDGFQFADMVRQHPRHADTAIIFVSAARLAEADYIGGYAHGGVDYVSVPIAPELLRAKVKVFAELYRRKRELEMLYAQMRSLSSSIIQLQDEERRRIARELHDGLGQQLTIAKIAADGIKVPKARKQVAEVSELIDEAIRQIRTISHLLHPPLLDEIGLKSAVQWYLDELSKRSGLEASLEVEPNDFPRLSPRLETALYRIIQEAVTNAYRHSKGRNICVVLRQDPLSLSLSIRDDGAGIPDGVAEFRLGSVGIGLGGMRQRVLELGGKLKLEDTHPGTVVEAVIPLAVLNSFPCDLYQIPEPL